MPLKLSPVQMEEIQDKFMVSLGQFPDAGEFLQQRFAVFGRDEEFIGSVCASRQYFSKESLSSALSSLLTWAVMM